MNTARQSVLRKLRIYSNNVYHITEQLDMGEIDEGEAERLLIALDERFADLLLRIDIVRTNNSI